MFSEPVSWPASGPNCLVRFVSQVAHTPRTAASGVPIGTPWEKPRASALGGNSELVTVPTGRRTDAVRALNPFFECVQSSLRDRAFRRALLPQGCRLSLVSRNWLSHRRKTRRRPGLLHPCKGVHSGALDGGIPERSAAEMAARTGIPVKANCQTPD